MRLQGGTNGILAAIDQGWLDPLDPWLAEERELPRLSGSDQRRIARRIRRRLKKFAGRAHG